MFTLDDKKYDETKMNDAGKVAFVQLQNIRNRNTERAMAQDCDNVLAQHYTKVLKENLPEEEKEKVKSKK